MGRRSDERTAVEWSPNELQQIAESDDACRAKFGGSPYLMPMIGSHARSATVRVMPVKVDE